MTLYLAVGAGAAIGALARHIVTLLVAATPVLDDYVATAGVNVLGSFAIGLVATLAGPDGRLLLGTRGRQFLMSGLCGGFTTFSLASLDTLSLIERGDFALATLYMASTVVLSLLAVWFGHRLATRLND